MRELDTMANIVNGVKDSNGESPKTTSILPVDVSRIGHFYFSDSRRSFLEDWHVDVDRDSLDGRHLLEAAEKLRSTDIPVAFPTETVYGLGADATRTSAVLGIYKAKQRPADNPLIVHICSITQLRHLLQPYAKSKLTTSKSQDRNDADPIPAIYHPLIRQFWPGPLTILLSNPPDTVLAPEVTAGLPTFGVRMPSSPLALALIKIADTPLAAPSANASTKPSPTTAEHVLHDLNGRIDIILDAGPCEVGVESTVVDGLSNPPLILRPGGISLDQIRECQGWANVVKGYKDGAERGNAPRAPGMKYKHYSPRAKVILVEPGVGSGGLDISIASNYMAHGVKSIGILRTRRWKADQLGTTSVDGDEGKQKEPEIWDIGLGNTTTDIAQNLFSGLRELDQKGVDVIFVEGIDDSEGDAAAAVMNRLRKAAEVEIKS